jgi:outer membrane biosynthesis protein TonB
MHLVRNIGRGPVVVHDLRLNSAIQPGAAVSVEEITAGLRQLKFLGLVSIESEPEPTVTQGPTEIPAPPVAETEPENAEPPQVDSAPEPEPEPAAEPEPEQATQAEAETQAEPDIEIKPEPEATVNTKRPSVAEVIEWIGNQTDAEVILSATQTDRRYTVKSAVRRRLQVLTDEQQPH